MEPFDPRSQSFNLTSGDGGTVSVSLVDVDNNIRNALNICVSYGSQIGASIMMLLVVLAMNSTVRLTRAYTGLQIAALVANIARMVVLALFFPSEWNEFYAFYTGDFSYVPPGDYHMSVAGNVLSLVVVVLVELCLIMQAWTMVTLWPDLWKWITAGVSATFCLVAIGLRFAFCVIQSQFILTAEPATSSRWLPRATITVGAVSIFWYCALFNVQLVAHLVKNRRFLPDASGLSSMEVLVFANGILMVVPAVFASLQWVESTSFEAASLTYTSVVIILPLGTLVAHRLTGQRSPSHSMDTSGWNSKPSATHSSSITCANPYSRVVTRIEVPKGKESHFPVDMELSGSEQGSARAGGVRVHREVDQTVESLA